MKWYRERARFNRIYGPQPISFGYTIGNAFAVLGVTIIAIVIAAVAILYAAVRPAGAASFPQPCVELAARENKPLPVTKRQLRRAKWNVEMLSLFGDPLAESCRVAFMKERK